MILESKFRVILAALALTVPSLALDATRALSEYEYERWHMREGLVYGAVHEIVQTTDGYIWLGTEQGLVRFNGSSFTLFDASRTGGLVSGDVRKLYVDPQDGLLVCSSGGAGLVRYKDHQFAKVRLAGDPTVNCRTLLMDHAGNMWIGTHYGGLRIFFKDGSVRSYTTAEGLAGDAVKSIIEDRRGDVWVAAYQGTGLSRFHAGKIENFGTRDGLPDDRVRNLLEDREGRLWVTTWDGLAVWDRPGSTSIRRIHGISSPRVITAVQDFQGSLWFGTVGGGLNRLVNGRFSAVDSRNGVVPDEVLSIFEDRDRSLWIGGGDGSLTRIRDRKISILTQRDGLPNDNVKVVFEDSKGTLWIGTAAGAARLGPGGMQRMRSAPLGHAFITALGEDSQGAVWIGTLGFGACRVSGEAQTCYTTADGLTSNTVRAIAADRDGVVWIATVEGLNRFSRGRITTYRTSEGLPDDDISAVLVDRGGGLWLGTKGGLSRFDGERFVNQPNQPPLPGGVRSLFQDADGSIWAATRTALVVWRDGRPKVINLPDISVHGNIVQIVRDTSGQLWARTESHICRIEGIAGGGRADGSPQLLRLRYIEPNSDLAYSTASTSQQPAACATRSGLLWFASFKGLVQVNPLKLQLNSTHPPVVIEDVIVDGRKSVTTGLIELPPGSLTVTVRFSALSFAAPNSNRFKYKLTGYDPDWVDSKGLQEATYGRLPAGDYQFRVMAASEEGVWNETGASIRMHKDPPWFLRLWFIGICAALLTGGAWVLHRRHLASVEQRAAAIVEERARIAHELHDTLEQGVAAITLQLDAIAAKIERSPAAARSCLDVTRTMARHVMAEARQAVLDMGSPALQEGRGFPAALQRVAMELTNGTSMRVEFSVEDTSTLIPPQMELHLLRIGQEAVANAVRHSGADTIQLSIAAQEGGVCLSIKDNGRGFQPNAAPSALSGHFGLLAMQQRANRIGAELTVHSEVGRGTVVVVAARARPGLRIGGLVE